MLLRLSGGGIMVHCYGVEDIPFSKFVNPSFENVLCICGADFHFMCIILNSGDKKFNNYEFYHRFLFYVAMLILPYLLIHIGMPSGALISGTIIGSSFCTP